MDAIPGGKGLFCHLQAALRAHTGRTLLAPAVHNKLDYWRRIIAALRSRPYHMVEVVFQDLTNLGARNAYRYGMCGVFRGPNGILFV